ncbi:MAG: hypothetical protein LUQ07_05695 [Methanospirillum sp.]|nr:hypothetical protein [Methanospirillum sp.]
MKDTTGRNKEEEERFRQSLFTRWTAGLSPVDQRISIFSHIRDIPYAIVSEWRNTDDIIRLMVTEDRGWCGPKHQLLIWMFGRLGIRIQPHYIPFRWQDQQVRYPATLRAIVPFLPESTHLCCKAYLEQTWQLLDATWDPPLVRVGFPINDPWDGVSGTIPAVTVTDPDERRQNITPLRVSAGNRAEFVPLLNRWMEEVRSRKKE